MYFFNTKKELSSNQTSPLLMLTRLILSYNQARRTIAFPHSLAIVSSLMSMKQGFIEPGRIKSNLSKRAYFLKSKALRSMITKDKLSKLQKRA